MNQDLNELLLDFKNKLAILEGKFQNDQLEKTTSNILSLCKAFIEKSKEYYVDKCIDNVKNQIFFFKILKPKLVSTFEFYQQRHQLINDIPVGCENLKKKFLNKKVKEYNKVFKRDKTFYSYVKSGETSLDEVYFTECKFEDICIYVDVSQCFYDYSYYSRYGKHLAEIKTATKMINLCHSLSQSPTHIPIKQTSIQKIKWTNSNIDFSELILALHEGNCFNDGKVNMSDIEKKLMECIEIEGSNDHYSNLRNIRNRVKDGSKFTGFLKSKVDSYLEKKDSI